MNTRFSVGDLLSVAVASALAAAVITYAVTYDPPPPPVTVTERVTPPACERALNQADTLVGDAAAVIDVANNVSALLQDVYDAGAAGADIAPTVRGWVQDLRAADRDADTTKDTFDLNTQLCIARTP